MEYVGLIFGAQSHYYIKGCMSERGLSEKHNVTKEHILNVTQGSILTVGTRALFAAAMPACCLFIMLPFFELWV